MRRVSLYGIVAIMALSIFPIFGCGTSATSPEATDSRYALKSFQVTDDTWFNHIEMYDARNGWLYTRTGLFNTNDGGTTWILVYDKSLWYETENDKYIFAMPTPTRLLTLRSNEKLVILEYNGNEWEISEIDLELRGLSWLGGSTGFGWNQKDLLKTTDSGETWTTVPTSVFIDSCLFTSATEGWAISNFEGGIIHETLDGGQNWKLKEGPPIPSYRVDPDTDLIVVDPKSYSYARIFDLAVTSDNIAWALYDNGFIVRSSDGGKNWTIVHSPDGRRVGDRVGSFAPLTDDLAYALSFSGTLLKTTDGGQSWKDVSKLPTPAYVPDSSFHPVEFVDENTGWVIGFKAGVFKTTDGGRTWANQAANLKYYENIGGNSISGTITNDKTSDPVVGAKVSLMMMVNYNPRTFETVTDSDGRYQLKDLASGFCSLSITGLPPGHNRMIEDTFEVSGEMKKDYVSKPKRDLSGTIRDPYGNPVSIPIMLSFSKTAWAESNADGTYSAPLRRVGIAFSDNDIKQAFLTADFPNQAPNSSTTYRRTYDLHPIDPGDKLTGFDFTWRFLDKTLSVSGTITDQSSKVIDEGVVLFSERELGISCTHQIGEPGAYQLKDLPTGDYQVLFKPEPGVAKWTSCEPAVINFTEGTPIVQDIIVPVTGK